MAFRAICVALLLAILPIAGCGTVANLARQGPDGGMAPFGGVCQDVSCMKKAAAGDAAFGSHPPPESERHPQAAILLLCAADIPLSLAGDLVTWPYTVAYNFINQPVPVPPIIQGPPTPVPPVTQAPAPVSPDNSSELLPEPRKLP